MKKVLVLGSTGTVGVKALELLSQCKDAHHVAAIVFAKDIELGAKQAIEHEVSCVVVADESKVSDLRNLLAAHPKIRVAGGTQAVSDIASDSYDIVIGAISGMAALESTFLALQNSKKVALANKESIVCAGHLLTKYIDKIIPLDSEHNGIFQILEACGRENIAKIVITASGGPFWFKPASDMINPSIAEVVSHPKWKMGSKISVDSATMMNKGLELIEAAYLFQRDISDFDALVHPEALVHAMVTYIDGATFMHCGATDMKLPISYALSYPTRKKCGMDYARFKNLSFYEPDHQRFPLLKLAVEAWSRGPISLIVLNVANEWAVAAFLGGKIRFSMIHTIVEMALTKCTEAKIPASIEDIRELSLDVERVCSTFYKTLRDH